MRPFLIEMQYCNIGTISLFSQTSAVQLRRSVSGGLVKSRFPAFLLLQLDVSIAFTRTDTRNLTFGGGGMKKYAGWFLFNSALGDGGRTRTLVAHMMFGCCHEFTPNVLTLLGECVSLGCLGLQLRDVNLCGDSSDTCIIDETWSNRCNKKKKKISH